MKRINYIFAIGLFCWSTISFAVEASFKYGEYQPITQSNKAEKPSIALVNWNTPEGIQRLERSKFRDDFFRLAHFYQPQINPLYCGIATSVMVLNAMRAPVGAVPSQSMLEVTLPSNGKKVPFQSYSQITFLNEKTDKIKKRAVIELKNKSEIKAKGTAAIDPGLSLAQLKAILETYQLNVEMKYAEAEPDKKAIESFRADIKTVLSDPKRFLIVNIDGHALGAATKGHISPIAAYDEKSDSVLFLDVAGHKNPWYWVPVADLYQAMHTKDGQFYRGYLILKDNQLT